MKYSHFVKLAKKQFIEDTLREVDGSVSEAARQMGVSRTCLYRMFERYNVDTTIGGNRRAKYRKREHSVAA